MLTNCGHPKVWPGTLKEALEHFALFCTVLCKTIFSEMKNTVFLSQSIPFSRTLLVLGILMCNCDLTLATPKVLMLGKFTDYFAVTMAN